MTAADSLAVADIRITVRPKSVSAFFLTDEVPVSNSTMGSCLSPHHFKQPWTQAAYHT